jgi:hypothetical protein
VSQRIAQVVIGTVVCVVVGLGLITRVIAQNGPPAHQKLTFDGDTALWTMAIKPDKTADFEQIMSKMRSALLKSEDPARRQQAAGWKVMRMTQPLSDGTIAYVHIVHPVVKDADYTIMQALYEAFPNEARPCTSSTAAPSRRTSHSPPGPSPSTCLENRRGYEIGLPSVSRISSAPRFSFFSSGSIFARSPTAMTTMPAGTRYFFDTASA